ncbi:hypothetical protein WJX73_004084 [Symbiochloris irregularis]|uniref:DNA topoisomerase n=1 Tax=Symbiochloris irregularis TaxID=706552 RepID=A0AAW1P560_9CHLO
MVAEKPSLALSIASFLADRNQMHSRRGQLDVHEFEGRFQGRPAHFKMTSVIGHVLSIDFLPQFQNWETTHPASLFDAGTKKSEANPKAHVCRHLQSEAKGCTHLVLWLDCDREGENICFEVMEHTLAWMQRVPGQQVFRARFSSITAPDIRAAMDKLVQPNENEALAVDARQELDLKVGVAFTRFQTRFFQGRYGNLDARLVSYGPCQTPTLAFCVERSQSIAAFQPQPFWSVRPHASKQGQALDLQWDKGRLFDQEVTQLYQHLVAQAGQLRVASVTEHESRKHRPHGLNTVELLKVASASMGLGPHYAMQIAERLYTSGFISYPRTESSGYPPGFDFSGTLASHRSHPIWGQYVLALLQGGVQPPKGGKDVGDHPPITPACSATEAEVGGGDAWRIYDYVARHFLGSLSADAVSKKTKVVLSAGGESFHAEGVTPLRSGFTAIMPWKATEAAALPPMTEGEALPITSVELHQGKTSPPDYLSESDLIALMEKHGIGTDASIAVHINNICERNYVSIQAGRKVVPTELGNTLVRGYQKIDPELCSPQVRGHVEAQLSLIAAGKAEKGSVVMHTLAQFAHKFRFFVAHIARMDSLFEASFSPLSSSGKPLSKCGKCARYMKLISARPTRLYCPSCEEVLALPQGGTIKLYKGLSCPLDSYELVLFSQAGPDARTFPLCPFCFNHPLEGAHLWGAGAGSKGGMPCTMCPHLGCKHSFLRQGVTPCPECDAGTLVLDPVSAPKWRLDCNRCNFLIYLPLDLHSVRVSRRTCEECDSNLLKLSWKKGSASAIRAGSEDQEACAVCDEDLRKSCDVKHGRSYAVRRGGGRSRGRRGRRGGRGRGRGREDPLMSFRDF